MHDTMKESAVGENLWMQKKEGVISRTSEAIGLKRNKDSSVLKGDQTEQMGTLVCRWVEIVEILKGLFSL